MKAKSGGEKKRLYAQKELARDGGLRFEQECAWF
jgi:hypothetical protein